MKARDWVILLITAGVLVMLCSLVIGEIIMCRHDGGEINDEVITLVKMSITGLIGIVAGYIGGKR